VAPGPARAWCEDAPVSSQESEPSDTDAWARHTDTPWGRLQASLLRRRLLGWHGEGRVESVLDVGCGFGDLAAALAPTADQVVCVDRSEAMLAAAQRSLSSAPAAARFERRDLDDGLAGLGTHALVVAHNVIDYATDPRQALAEISARVEPRGRLSISFGNAAAQALRHAVITHDLNEAIQLARLPEVRLPGPCGESLRLRRSIVEGWLEDEGLQVTGRAGVRVLIDLLPNKIKDEALMPAIEELELELGSRPELVDVGAMVHLVAARP
jgi:S-adenosylmethionine-dependent methyltransferase